MDSMEPKKTCKHQLRRPPDLVVDGAGETVLLYECVICGFAFGLILNSEDQADRMVILPPEQECA